MAKAKKKKTTATRKKTPAKKLSSAKVKKMLKGGALNPGDHMFGKPLSSVPRFMGGPQDIARKPTGGFNGGGGGRGGSANRSRAGR